MMKNALLTLLTFVTLINNSKASVPTAAHTFDTNVKVYNMTPAQEKKIRQAEGKIKDVVSSEAFRTAILNHTYAGKKQFVDTKLTNAQVYAKILQAAEIKYTSKNNRMDMGVKLYYENSNTVGFTTKAITYINCNTKYFNTFSPSQVAGNMTHEWLHKLGFEHAVNYSKPRDYSVPYAIGALMRKLASR